MKKNTFNERAISSVSATTEFLIWASVVGLIAVLGIVYVHGLAYVIRWVFGWPGFCTAELTAETARSGEWLACRHNENWVFLSYGIAIFGNLPIWGFLAWAKWMLTGK